jgi:hypothetical protein
LAEPFKILGEYNCSKVAQKSAGIFKFLMTEYSNTPDFGTAQHIECHNT